MSNCPTSSFSILQESLLANVRRKLNWGWVSAGTGKIMIPGLCSNTGTFLLPLLQRNAVVSGLVRGCPSAQQSPALPCGIARAPHQGQQWALGSRAGGAQAGSVCDVAMRLWLCLGSRWGQRGVLKRKLPEVTAKLFCGPGLELQPA